MGLDPTEKAQDLIVTKSDEEIRAIIQNAQGLRSGSVRFEEGYRKHITIALIETDERLSAEEFAAIFQAVAPLGVTNIQTPFDASVPAVPGKKAALTTTAQLRFEDVEPAFIED